MSSFGEEKKDSIPHPTFSNDWEMFKFDIDIHGEVKGYRSALTSKHNLPEDPNNITGSDEEKKLAKEASQKNNLAIVYLNYALRKEKQLKAKIRLSANKAYPTGRAHVVMKELAKKFESTDIAKS